MKIRTDFVSNSSSSSFIIEDNEFIKKCDISKSDVILALKECGAEGFDVYDMTSDTDKQKCFEAIGDTLKWFDAKNTNGIYTYEQFEDVLGNLGIVIRCDGNTQPECYNMKTHKREHLPEFVVDTFKYIRERCGIKTMYEVANAETAKFVIHFDDNHLWMLQDIGTLGKDDAEDEYLPESEKYICTESEWDSEANTGLRFFEILIKKLMETKQVDVKNKDFDKFKSWIETYKMFKPQWVLHEG